MAYGICLYKNEKYSTKVLMCKSILSKNRWGFLKGVQDKDETNEQTAIREFHEECGILVEKEYLEKMFLQENETKDIGIYLVNYDNISKVERFFENEKLYQRFLSWENNQVQFFDISQLPKIKTKQQELTEKIIKYFK